MKQLAKKYIGWVMFVVVMAGSLYAFPRLTRADESSKSNTQKPSDVTASEQPLRMPDGVTKDKFYLYLLVGQSNMAGRGKITPEDLETNPRVYALGVDGQWVLGKAPLHHDIKTRGVGPGLTFGKAMAKAHPDVTIGLIPAAVGGTIIEWWLPGAQRGLFDNAINQAKRAMSTGTLKGIIWQQGESDSTVARAPLYHDRLITLLHAFRHELGDDNLPIVIGGLGDFLKSSKAPVVNAALEEVAGEINNAAFAPASKRGNIGDRLHFNTAAAHENGEIMAEKMLSLEKAK